MAAALVVLVLVAGCADEPARSVGAAEPAGRLTVHPVLGTTDDRTLTDPDELDPEVDSSVADPDGGPALVIGPAALTGADVARAAAEPGQPEGPADAVTVEWTEDGAVRWSELTGRAACVPEGDPARRIVVLLDGEVVSAPVVSPAVQCDVGVVGGATQLTGSFTAQEAERIAAQLRPEGG